MATKIFVNGTFDIIHSGHLFLLEYAKSRGDYLKVGLDSDERVSELKGPTRPVNNICTRYHIMASLKWVDEVGIFDSDESLTEMVRLYKPDIMIVGAEYEGRKIIGSEYAKELKFFNRVDNYSTTNTIKNIRDERGPAPAVFFESPY